MDGIDVDALTLDETSETREVLFEIIREKNIESLQKFLDQNNVEKLSCNLDGWFAMHEAVDLGYVEAVKTIVEFAQLHNVNALSKWDQAMTFHPKLIRKYHQDDNPGPSYQTSFLTLSVRSGNLNMVNYLISLYKRRCDNNRGIYEAILESVAQPNILEILLETFPTYVNKSFEDLFGLLHYAVRRNSLQGANVLLKYKVDVNAECKVKYMCVIMNVVLYSVVMACENDDTRMLKILIDAGADLEAPSDPYSPVNLLNPVVGIPLLFAVASGSIDLVKFLVKHEANVYTSVTGYFGYSSLFPSDQYKVSAITMAVIHKKIDMMKYFLTVVDKEKLGRRQQTSPVVAAVRKVLPKALDILLKDGYNADGSLPHYEKLDHPWGGTMLNNVTVYMDDMNDLHKPALSVLQTLLTNGVKFTNKEGVEMLDFILFYPEKSCHDTLKIVINHGLVEFVFGKAIKKLGEFLTDEWHHIESLLNDEPVLHEREYWITQRNIPLYLQNFKLFLDLVSLYKTTNGSSLVSNVPSLKQLSRYTIRSSVVSKFKTLQPIQELSLPVPLLKYLIYV